ncbi:hypothetical protein L798_11288 [Zootermopsis nevadensis]|uniref:Uncharacterized protein n=1 Tax=Zootermopsis nevadensis TaxID=136037 RepID=A0A067QW51_ZOONE|nr:hypothetical protein L798_11288 [Zootermopsis nevadensis]
MRSHRRRDDIRNARKTSGGLLPGSGQSFHTKPQPLFPTDGSLVHVLTILQNEMPTLTEVYVKFKCTLSSYFIRGTDYELHQRSLCGPACWNNTFYILFHSK